MENLPEFSRQVDWNICNRPGPGEGEVKIEVCIKLLNFAVYGDNDHHDNDDDDDDDDEDDYDVDNDDEDDYTTEMPGVVGGVGRIANLLMWQDSGAGGAEFNHRRPHHYPLPCAANDD